MEILILGGILVALMVYVSTRIKRSAADAYEEERVETDIFAITKPAGFIIIESEDPKVVFAAYSKEYGADDADNIRQVSAQLMFHQGRSLESVSIPIKETAQRVFDERHLAGPSVVLETERQIDRIPVETEYHLTQKGDDTYEFSVSSLAETKEANQREITTLLSSFELK
jgi:hypothetical protein